MKKLDLLSAVRFLVTCTAAGILVTAARADTPACPIGYPDRITSAEAAAALDPATRIAFACEACQSVLDLGSVDKGSFLAWFSTLETHDCPGCGGKVLVKQGQGPRLSPTLDYSHSCTKCGDQSAFICATHATGKCKANAALSVRSASDSLCTNFNRNPAL